MTDTLSILAFGVGAFFTGVAFAVKTILSLAARHSDDNGEGCLANLFAGVAFAIALVFFYLCFAN